MFERLRQRDPIDIYVGSRKDLNRRDRKDLKRKLTDLSHDLKIHQGERILVHSHFTRSCELFTDPTVENGAKRTVMDQVHHYDLGQINADSLIFPQNHKKPAVAIPTNSFLCLESSGQSGKIPVNLSQPMHIQQRLDEVVIGEDEIKRWANLSASNAETFRLICEALAKIAPHQIP